MSAAPAGSPSALSAASLAFVAMLVAGDFFKAMSSEDQVEAEPPLVIEGK